MVEIKKRTINFSVLLVFFAVAVFMIVSAETLRDASASDDGDCTNGAVPIPASFAASNSINGWTSVVTKVRKNGGGYTDLVYAKPGDSVTYVHCHYPGAQKVANTRVTNIGLSNNSTNRPSSIPNSSATVYPYKYTTIGAITQEEINSHVRVWDINDGHPEGHYPNEPAEFDDGPYSTIANFSRVMNLFGYYGGLNIFYTAPWYVGYVTPMGEKNGFNVGNNPITGVGKYTEWQRMLAPNHAAVNNGATDPNGSSWSCSYVTNENPYTTDSCKHFDHYEKKTIPAHCSKDTSGIVLPGGAPPQAYCSAAGGSWINAQEVDDTTKPVYRYDNPCRVTHYTTCSRGSGNDSKYITYTMNTDTRDGTAPIYDEATVIVPYNFQLAGDARIQNDYAYAGETVTLTNFSVRMESRYNSLTDGTYSTEAPVVKAEVVTFLASNQDGSGKMTGDRSAGVYTKEGGMSAYGSWVPLNSTTVNVDDTDTGNYFCVQLKYYPQNSGTESNYEDPEGSHSWGVSAPSCKPIARKPSFQVWGSGIYSGGDISVLTAAKNNLYGNTSRPYKVNGVSGANVFGSWAELGMMAIGTNNGLYSSAILNESSSWGKFESNPGNGLCQFGSYLAFANFQSGAINICNGTTVYDRNGNFAGSGIKIDKKTLLEDIMPYDTPTPARGFSYDYFPVGAPGTYDEIMTANGKLVRYTYNKGAIAISKENSPASYTYEITPGSTGDSGNTPVSTTYIVRSDGDVRIDRNIVQQNNSYRDIDEMPKLIIYAGGNINIWCGVTRIDAVLIAEKTVNTCNDYNNSGTSRNIQLRINGSVIADRIELNRTYGAGKGSDSGTPAEIINYDSSLLLWGRAQADTASSATFHTTYTRELAPRY